MYGTKVIFSMISFCLIMTVNAFSQDTLWVNGFRYSSKTRDSLIAFPEGDHHQYSKILMMYSMRCKGSLVSTSAERNKGCGEWDYSCNTNIIDSTRTDSLKVLHPNYVISGLNDNFFSYTTRPTFTYYSFVQKNVTASGTAGITTLPVAGQKGDIGMSPAENPSYKGYFIYPSSALPQGLAGTVSGLRLFHQGSGKLPFFKIRLAYGANATLDPADLETLNFSEVVNREVIFGNGAFTDVYFHTPITFPGSGNVILEISYHGNTEKIGSIKLAATSQPSTGRAIVSGVDGYVSLGAQGSAKVPVAGLRTVRDAITLSFWSKGNKESLPANNSAFHAVDAKGNRQLNAHLPWSNSRIYWDCGGDGTGYDRIDKAAVAAEFEDVWHHWTFTKNTVTGSMKIYLDGVLWHSGTGKKKPIDIQEMLLGTDQAGNLPYPGDMDQFCVWNRELSVSEIQRSMSVLPSEDVALQQGLVLEYAMNEQLGKTIKDNSDFRQDGQFDLDPERRMFRANDIFKEFRLEAHTLDIAFLKGTATINVTEIQVRDSIQNRPVKVIPYRIENKKLVQDAPIYVWASGFFPVLDEDGTILDEVEFVEEDVLFIDNLVYYNYYPSRYELLSFVTPYGIGLDLGPTGKTWMFDVSDYAPILKGKKRLLMDKGGEWQEEIDIRFAFVRGTPPRPVLDIRQVWPATSYGYTSILQNQHLEPRTLPFDPSKVSSMKVRTVATGHGQEGEFISRLHSINVNGGTTDFVWPLWKECADNAIYPQGGTWVYDRAGWCPGAPSDLREFEIMSLAGQSGEVTLDYGLNTASGDSRYIVNTQLVTYGKASFTLDAAITDILSPTNRVEYKRQNPFCGKPVVRIQNYGSEALKNATLKYTCGGNVYSYAWTGNLSFLQSQEVQLPELPANDLFSGNTFRVWITNTNGREDENPKNNVQTSAYEHPAVIAGDLVVGLKTNGMPAETSWKVRNAEGQVVAGSKPNLTGFTLYQDTIRSLQGCYELQFTDNDDDGISWWANGDGDGFIRAKGTQSNWSFFNPDFGREFTFHFYAGTVSTASEVNQELSFSAYPNPFGDELFVHCKGLRGNVVLSLQDQTGRVLIHRQYSGILPEEWTETLDASVLPSGLYVVTLTTKEGSKSVRCIKLD